jgi:hypothetical protein
MLVAFSRHIDDDLYVRGREIGKTGQILEIMSDGIYEIFASRSGHRAQVFEMVAGRTGNHLGGIVIKAEDGEDKKFPCTYYAAKTLVQEWQSGVTTPNHLMPVFGGVTMLSIGSDSLDAEGLQRVGDELSHEIHIRQFGQGVLLS